MINEANEDKETEDTPLPPGSPEKAPVKDPSVKDEPMGDPQPPEKKTPRLS